MRKPVSFQIAKLLKEKGFDGFTYTNKYRPEWYHIKYGSLHEYDFFSSFDNMLKAPFISDVVMWLYDTHDIWIEVSREYANGKYIYQYFIDTDNQEFGFDSPEKAYEAAVKYVVENLI